MTSINILHISDLHISSMPMRKEILDINNFHDGINAYYRFKNKQMAASQDPRIMEALASFTFERKSFLDCILVTGDIATEGKLDDLKEAHRFITDKSKPNSFRTDKGYPTLNISSKLPILLLPGNHDRYIPKGRLWSPGGNVFSKVFQKFWKDDVVTYTINKKNYIFSVVAADFSLRDSKHSTVLGGKLSQGYVYEDILEKIEKKTVTIRKKAKKKKKKCVVTWAVHFPPYFPYKLTDLRLLMKLTKEGLLTSSAKKHNVKLIMAGHSHKHKFYFDKTNAVMIACAGTATQFYSENEDNSNHCHVIRVEFGKNSPLFSINNFRFDRRKGEFVPV